MSAIRHQSLLLVLLLALAAPSAAQDRSGPPAGGPPGGRPGGGPQGPPQGAIVGRVLEADTGTGIEAATVAVWSAADSALVTGTISEPDGRFAIEGIRPGRYYVRVTYVGFRTETRSDVAIRPQAPRVDLGDIRLAGDSNFMQEVEVTAERAAVEVSIDKTVYNTKDQPVTSGGSASDVLRNIPSVEVDADGSLSLRGNQNVAVLINGRPSPMTGEALASFLQGLPAESVERVEVIPNPSARYDPDGMSGILNIVLRQDTDLGLGGSVTANGGTQSAGGSASLNYGKGPWGVFASYGLRLGNRDNEGFTFRENRFMDPLTYLDQDELGERDMFSHNLNTTVDYRLSKLNNLTFSALVSRRGGDQTGLTAYRELNAAQALTDRFEMRRAGSETDFNMDYRLAFKRTLDAGKHELSAEVRYEQEWEDEDESFQQHYLTEAGVADPARPSLLQRNTGDEDQQEGTLQLDYVRPMGQAGRLEAGYKGSLRLLGTSSFYETFDAALDRYVVDQGLTNAFDFDEQIHAAYGIYQNQFGRFGLQTGVRLEQAMTTFDLTSVNQAYDNDYFSYFPSAFLTYQLQQSAAGARQLKLSYSKRINRPNMWQLNPIGDFEDPLFRRMGNPYLKPEYTHSFEASYSQFMQATSLTLTPYFRRTVDVIRWYQEVTPEGVSVTTFKNLDTSDSWGAELIGTLRLARWLNGFGSFNAFRVVTDGSNVDTDYSNDAFGWAARGNATLTLSPTLDVQLSYFYRAPMDVEGGRMGAMSSADIAVRQKLFGDRASLSVRVSDPFATMVMHGFREDDRFYQEMRREWNARQVNLSLTYNFGRQQPRRRDQNREGQDRGDMEEMQQQGGM